MPIEVPDTRAFAEPPRRRRRSPAVPEVPAPEAPAAELVAAEAGSAFAKPVRRRAAAKPVAEAAAEPAVASAFSRPVRRRPRTEATAAVVPPVPEPTVSERVEERRGAEGKVEAVAEVTDTVVVRLGGTRYAVAMDAVAEVGRPPHVTRVPGVPGWISGVANWRGRILPVVDLRVLLGAPTPDLGLNGRVVVLARGGVTLGLLAERVEGVVSLELDQLEPVLLTLSRSTASVLAGQLIHPDGPIAVLDLETVFALRSQLPRVRRAG